MTTAKYRIQKMKATGQTCDSARRSPPLHSTRTPAAFYLTNEHGTRALCTNCAKRATGLPSKAALEAEAFATATPEPRR